MKTRNLDYRMKRGLIMSLWLGLCMLLISALFAWLLEREFVAFYFTESYVFYEILIVMIAAFAFTFVLAGGRPKK